MLNRYIGNKKSILEPIISQVKEKLPNGGRVCDAFSGSLAVSFELKKEGYEVSTNDINLFSHFYGKHLIEQCSLPEIELASFNIDNVDKHINQAQLILDRGISGAEDYSFLRNKKNSHRFQKLLTVYLYLNNLMDGKPKGNSYFFDTYTEEGKNSHFESQRGTIGRRKFFTPSNGRRLDLVMNQIRKWNKDGVLEDGYFKYTLVCSVIDALEKVSNTQGTYHDFPRDKYDSRAHIPLMLYPPNFDGIISKKKKHIIGRCEDSIEFVSKIPSQDLLYLDPPYNFRQYTSYYFLPNVLCEYIDMDDLKIYFDNVQFVRGQNMTNDFNSSFSKKNEFIKSLYNLVKNCDTKNVLMSYFDGRNHWNNTADGTDVEGKEVLLKFFNSELFIAGTCDLIPFDRLNYQSYGGHKAKFIKEFLFSGVKK
ncbi:DNA adenine methylase [Cellvibrio sp. UBA7671]|uniref:DNA adenine methylase n=1 Tax=Cellvibrio sp. UBA7671 TaxID=1946312 RepID=UPI002F35B5FA